MRCSFILRITSLRRRPAAVATPPKLGSVSSDLSFPVRGGRFVGSLRVCFCVLFQVVCVSLYCSPDKFKVVYGVSGSGVFLDPDLFSCFGCLILLVGGLLSGYKDGGGGGCVLSVAVSSQGDGGFNSGGGFEGVSGGFETRWWWCGICDEVLC
ncbi:hypothetical protein P8452_09537 [Trifolium repens]|nr:hypothetical protein P8452_09537 [Trifolium repens]